MYPNKARFKMFNIESKNKLFKNKQKTLSEMKVKTVEQKFKDVLFQRSEISDVELIKQVNELNIRSDAEFKALLLIVLRKAITEKFKN